MSRARIDRGVAVVAVRTAAVDSCLVPFAFAAAVSAVEIVISEYAPLPTDGISIPSIGAIDCANTYG